MKVYSLPSLKKIKKKFIKKINKKIFFFLKLFKY